MNKMEYQRRRKVESFNLEKIRPLGCRTKRSVFEGVELSYRIRMFKFKKKHVKLIESTCCFFSYIGLLKHMLKNL